MNEVRIQQNDEFNIQNDDHNNDVNNARNNHQNNELNNAQWNGQNNHLKNAAQDNGQHNDSNKRNAKDLTPSKRSEDMDKESWSFNATSGYRSKEK